MVLRCRSAELSKHRGPAASGCPRRNSLLAGNLWVPGFRGGGRCGNCWVSGEIPWPGAGNFPPPSREQIGHISESRHRQQGFPRAVTGVLSATEMWRFYRRSSVRGWTQQCRGKSAAHSALIAICEGGGWRFAHPLYDCCLGIGMIASIQSHWRYCLVPTCM